MNNNRQLSSTAQTGINMVASFVTYGLTAFINFFLSPYIVKTVGVDAYGFVGLANNFISYISLITIALNALSGRFITVYIYKNDVQKANIYYTSVFYANLFLSGVMFVVETFILIFLEKLINIPGNLFWDVKLLFGSLMVSSIVGTVASGFSVSVFATNKLYLNSLRSIESSIARAIVLVILYKFYTPKVFYLGVTTLMVTVYCSLYDYYYVKKLTPFLSLNVKQFDIKSVIELTKSGIWNLITRLGQIFSDGLDLLITNLLIDTISMGVLSLAKTIPGALNSIVGMMSGTFSPNFTIFYAQEKYDQLLKSVKQAMKITGVIVNVPIIVVFVCGKQFYELWQPTVDSEMLQKLTILSCIGIVFTGGVNCIFNLFTVFNKLKFNSIVLLVSSFFSIIVTFVLLKTTNLGVYAVAGVSTIIMIIKNLFLILPYAAKCMKLKWYAFYSEVIRTVIFVIIGTAVGSMINQLLMNVIHINGWLNLIISCAFVGLTSLIIGYFVILDKNNRLIIRHKAKSYLYKFNIISE